MQRLWLGALMLLCSGHSAAQNLRLYRIQMHSGHPPRSGGHRIGQLQYLRALSTGEADELAADAAVATIREHKAVDKHRISPSQLSHPQLQLHTMIVRDSDMDWARQLDSTEGHLKLMRAGPTAAVFECIGECTEQALALVTNRPEVIWVEAERPGDFRLLNAWSSGVTQSGTAFENPFWAAGLNGTGQIVGCADTGIDLDSCLFWDDEGARGFAPFESVVPAARKIMRYDTRLGDRSDYKHGHGTHVSGSIAGQAKPLVGESVHGTAAASNFNGMAPAAKLHFTDIMPGPDVPLNLPTSLDGSDGDGGLSEEPKTPLLFYVNA